MSDHAQEAAEGLRQLAQALYAGRMTRDEWRSVMENLPQIARAIAYEVTGQGQIGPMHKRFCDGGTVSARDITLALFSLKHRGDVS